VNDKVFLFIYLCFDKCVCGVDISIVVNRLNACACEETRKRKEGREKKKKYEKESAGNSAQQTCCPFKKLVVYTPSHSPMCSREEEQFRDFHQFN